MDALMELDEASEEVEVKLSPTTTALIALIECGAFDFGGWEV
jgi:hypothetical protein